MLHFAWMKFDCHDHERLLKVWKSRRPSVTGSMPRLLKTSKSMYFEMMSDVVGIFATKKLFRWIADVYRLCGMFCRQSRCINTKIKLLRIILLCIQLKCVLSLRLLSVLRASSNLLMAIDLMIRSINYSHLVHLPYATSLT